MVERRETVKRPDVKHVGRGMGSESSSAFIRDLKEPPFVSRFSFRSHVPIFRSNRNLLRFTSYPFLNFLLPPTSYLFSFTIANIPLLLGSLLSQRYRPSRDLLPVTRRFA